MSRKVIPWRSHSQLGVIMTELERYMLECQGLIAGRDDFDIQRDSQEAWDFKMRQVAEAAATQTQEDIDKEKKKWNDLRLLAEQMDEARKRSKA